MRSVELVHEFSDLENDFVNVIVTDTTCYSYIMFVTTLNDLLKLMNNDSVNFIKPDALIIVKHLTQQLIEESINEY